jgi:hypothetical protein
MGVTCSENLPVAPPLLKVAETAVVSNEKLSTHVG